MNYFIEDENGVIKINYPEIARRKKMFADAWATEDTPERKRARYVLYKFYDLKRWYHDGKWLNFETDK